MRACVALLVLSLASCAREQPDLRLLTRSSFNLETTASPGDVVELDGALASCAKKTSLTLLNAGNATARFSAVSSSSDFSFRDGSVRFSPTSLGPKVQVGSVDSLNQCPALARTALLGTGVISALTGPACVDFGEVAVGASAELEVTVENLSFSPVLPEAPGDAFSVVSAEEGTGYRDDTGQLRSTP